MSGQVNLSRIHSERLRHFADLFPQDDQQMINLVVLRMDLPFDPGQRGIQEIFLPFLVPDFRQGKA